MTVIGGYLARGIQLDRTPSSKTWLISEVQKMSTSLRQGKRTTFQIKKTLNLFNIWVTLYTQTSMCMFFKLFPMHFLSCLPGDWKLRASFSWCSFLLFSWPSCSFQEWSWQRSDKLDACHDLSLVSGWRANTKVVYHGATILSKFTSSSVS